MHRVGEWLTRLQRILQLRGWTGGRVDESTLRGAEVKRPLGASHAQACWRTTQRGLEIGASSRVGQSISMADGLTARSFRCSGGWGNDRSDPLSDQCPAEGNNLPGA